MFLLCDVKYSIEKPNKQLIETIKSMKQKLWISNEIGMKCDSIELENLNLILMVVPVRCPFDNETKNTIDLVIFLLSLYFTLAFDT